MEEVRATVELNAPSYASAILSSRELIDLLRAKGGTTGAIRAPQGHRATIAQ